MDTPESTVYRGMEGTGAAQILGAPGNPMGAYWRRKNDVERRQAIAAEEERLAKEKRDKDMWDLINVSPEQAYAPFEQQVQDAAQQHRQKIVDAYMAGARIDDPKFKMMVKQGWDQVNTLARRSNHIKSTIDDTMKVIKENPYLDQQYYYPKIWDMYMDANGNGKPLKDIDPSQIQSIYEQDPMGFNANKYTKDFMSNVKSNVFNYVKQKHDNAGVTNTDIDVKIQGDLYTPDSTTKSGVKEDENGNPIINITPDFMSSYMDSATARRYFEAAAEKNNVPVKELISQQVRPQASFEKKSTTSFSRNPTNFADVLSMGKFGLKQAEIPIATRRAENIMSAINAFYNPDGSRVDQPSSAAQAALGAIGKNAKFGDGDILEATFVPGTNSPGSSQPMSGIVVPNSPNDRIVFKVKYSDRGLPKAGELDLSKPSAFGELNAIFETAKSEGGNRFGVDQLMALKGIDPASVYRGKETLSVNNEEMKKAENEAVNKIISAEDVDIPELVGQYYNGKQIAYAKKVTTDPGILGFGKKQVLEIGVPEGNSMKYYNLPNNYEDIANIFRGANKFKKSYKANGKEISIDELRKSYTDEEILQAIEWGNLE